MLVNVDLKKHGNRTCNFIFMCSVHPIVVVYILVVVCIIVVYVQIDVYILVAAHIHNFAYIQCVV